MPVRIVHDKGSGDSQQVARRRTQTIEDAENASYLGVRAGSAHYHIAAAAKALAHTGVYLCRASGIAPSYYTYPFSVGSFKNRNAVLFVNKSMSEIGWVRI